MKQAVDVAVIGAGHAGLNAIKEIRGATDSWVLINGGPLGTTCARIGCMPSKIAKHLAETYQIKDRLLRYGVRGSEHLAIDKEEAMEYVRDLRDTFVDLVLANTTDEMDAEHLIEGYAELLDAHRIRVGDREIQANSIVIATGARSVVPAEWEPEFGDSILTVDNLFDQARLPESVAVIGLGPIGIEIAQALRRLDIQVTGLDHGQFVARISDPDVNQAAIEILGREFPMWLGHEPQIRRAAGGGYSVRSGDREALVEKVFFAIGRPPNLERMRLDRLGVPLWPNGTPQYDPQTLKVWRHPIYIAGDATGGIANLQRAAKQGRVAGYNAVHRRPIRYRQHTEIAIIFAEPNIAAVGRRWDELDSEQVRGRTAGPPSGSTTRGRGLSSRSSLESGSGGALISRTPGPRACAEDLDIGLHRNARGRIQRPDGEGLASAVREDRDVLADELVLRGPYRWLRLSQSRAWLRPR